MVVGAIFFRSALGPESFVAACLRPLEAGREENHYQRTQDAASAALRADPQSQRWYVNVELLGLARTTLDGRLNASALAKEWEAALEPDADNLVSALCHAVVLGAVRGVPASDAAGQFELFRQCVGAEHEAARSRVYRGEWRRIWQYALQQRGLRDDFALRPGIQIDLSYGGIFCSRAFGVLPDLTARLLDLSKALDAAGRPADAGRCRRWAVRVAAELVRTEGDIGLALLGADLLERVAVAIPRAEPSLQRQVADWRKGLRASLHGPSGPSEHDWGDLSGRLPTLVSAELDRLLTAVGRAAVLAAMSVGAALAFVVSLFVAWMRRGASPCAAAASDADSSSRIGTRLLAMVAAVAWMQWLVAGRLPATGQPGVWLIVAAAAAFLSGLSIVCLTAPSFWRRRPFVAACLGLLAILSLLAPAMSPIQLSLIRRLLGRSPATSVILVGAVLLMILSVMFLAVRSRRRSSEPASAASSSLPQLDWTARWALVLVLLAWAAQVLAVRPADAAYRNATLAACADELTARLGSKTRDAQLDELRRIEAALIQANETGVSNPPTAAPSSQAAPASASGS